MAIAETASEHHLGQTIVKEAKFRSMVLDQEPEHIEVIKGNGLKAAVAGQILTIENRKLMNLKNIAD